MSKKYGFVYIWRDRKNNRYYVGSRWGHINDGYLCSSAWLHNSYKRRPQDFKRRILKIITTNRYDTYMEEQRWLNMIKDEELSVKYYNRTRNLKVGDGVPWNKGKTDVICDNTRQKMRQAKLGKTNPHKGKTLEELHGPEKAAEIKSKLIHSHLGQEAWNKGKEYLQIQGDNHWTKKKGGHTEESKEKIRQAKLGKEIPKNCGENHWTAKVQRPPHKTAAERQRDYRSRQKAKMESLNM